MTLVSAPGWPWHRRAGVRWAEIAAFAFALALSAYVVVLVREQAGGVAASVAATAMTLPVAVARRAPLAAAGILAAAAAANELFFGHLIRCGAALPAVFFVAYLAGRACAGRTRTLVLAGVLVSAAIQCLYDPRLGAPVIALMAAVSSVFAGAGILVRRRAGLVAELRRRTGQLREQREQTAALAVAAERARITADISDVLRERIDEIGRLARPGGDGTDHIDANFAAIELAGRAILDSHAARGGHAPRRAHGARAGPGRAEPPAYARDYGGHPAVRRGAGAAAARESRADRVPDRRAAADGAA